MRERFMSPRLSSTSHHQPHEARSAAPVIAEAAERRVLLSGTVMWNLASGDFDGDGSAETLVRLNAGRARLADLGFAGSAFRRGALMLIDDSGSLFGDPLGIRARGNAAPVAAVADFNSDGRLDLVLAGRRLSGVRNGLTFLPGNGDGSFGAGVSVAGAPSDITSLAAGDVNGDGQADLIGTARARSRGAGDGTGSAGSGSFLWDQDRSGEKEWNIDPLGVNDAGAHRPHLAGASAEAGGGVVTGSVLLPSGTGSGAVFRDSVFGDFDADISLAPGFTPPASRVGASAEAGGARVGGFADTFLGGGSFADTDQMFVLLGNGAGGFASSSNSTVD